MLSQNTLKSHHKTQIDSERLALAVRTHQIDGISLFNLDRLYASLASARGRSRGGGGGRHSESQISTHVRILSFPFERGHSLIE